MRQKTNYSELPNRVVVERIGASAVIYLTENIEEIKVEDSVSYLADTYAISTANTPDLKTRIEQNFAVWLAKAKQDEYDKLAETIRAERNRRLADTDYTCLADRQPSDAMIAYRQALRDLTKQEGFPYMVVWPEIL